MSLHVSLTAVYEPIEDGRVQARIREVPAVITAGPSLDEAKVLLLDALPEYLLSLGETTPTVADDRPVARERLAIVLGA
jgi:hypothetical protein